MKSSDKTLTDPRAEEKNPSIHTTRVRRGGASARGSRDAALRGSEEKFRRLFETAQDGILLLDARTGDITDTNPYIEKLLGYSRRELAGKKLWEIGPFKDAFASREAFRELQRKGYIRYEDLPLETRDGNRCEVEFVSNVYQVRNQKVIQCNVRDITERARIGPVLHESEERYRSWFENMLEGFAYCQMLYQRGQPEDFTFLAVNPAFEKLMGLKDIIGKKATEAIPGFKESDPALFEICGRAALTGRSEKFEMYVKSLRIWFSISVVSTQKGYFTAAFENITERMPAEEEALWKSEQRVRNIFENTTFGFYRTTPEGRILLANPSLIRMLGYETFEDLAHRDLEESGFEPQYPHNEFRQLVESKGEVRGLEAEWKKKDGTTIFVLVSATAFRNDDGKVLYFEGTVEDVTERKRAEEALRESEKRYRSLFEDSPISLWEEDFSLVKQYIEDLRKQGVADFRAYFKSHPEQFANCSKQIRVVDVNRATLKLFEAKAKTEIFNNLDLILGESNEALGEEFINIADGKSGFELQTINHTLSGEQRVINMRWSVAVGHENTLDQVLLSITDVTEQKQAEEALKVSEARYRSLYEDSIMGISQALPDGHLIHVNKAYAQMYGYASPNEILAETTDIGKERYANSEDREEVLRILNEEGVMEPRELPVVRRDGTRFWVVAGARAIKDANDNLLYYQATHVDITVRKQAEEALVRQTEELRERNDELDRLYRATGSLLSSTPFDLQSIPKTIVDIVRQEFGQANCSVFLINENELYRAAAAGEYVEQVSKVQLSLDGAGLVPQAIRSGRIINTRDVQTIPANVPNWELTRSELTIPLKVGDQVIGAIDVQSVEQSAFTPKDERLMSIFAERAAMALERGRLNGELEHRIQQLTSLRTIDMAISSSLDIHLTLSILLDQLTQQLGVDAADVLLFDPGVQTFKYTAGHGFRTQALQHTDLRLGDGYAGRAARDRQVVTIRDLPRNSGGLQRSADFSREGFITYIGVPLIAKGQVKGVLEILQRDELELDRGQHIFLDMLTGQAAIAIDSAQLFENLQGSNSELMMAYDETIEGWSRAMDLRDQETEGHSQRVTGLTLRLANSLGVGGEELVQIRRGTLLHDIGKMGVPDEILHKPGALTEEEWVVMRKHPQLAYDMLAPIAYLRSAIDIPYCHHEKWDGTGYPRGLKGEQIPLAARIFAVVDVWDALCSDRPYRKAWPEDKVLQHIQEQSGKHFDPRVVDVFMQLPN